MPIDGLFFTALVDELRPLLRQARIQGVSQPGEAELLLHLRRPGRSLRLVISADPSLARVHLTEADPGNAPAAPAFCLLLRKHLIPGRILDVVQAPFERALELRVEALSDEGRRVERSLVVEVMGRHSNVILLDRPGGVIIDALKRIPAARNRLREILPNRAYIPPPPQEGLDPYAVDFDAFDRTVRLAPASQPVAVTIRQRFMGFSPFAAAELIARAGLAPGVTREELGPDAIERLWESFRGLVDALRSGETTPCAVGPFSAFWCFAIHTVPGEKRIFDSLQTLLDATFHHLGERDRCDALRRKLEQGIARHMERAAKKAEKQRESVAQGERAIEWKEYGDLITAHLYRLGRFDPGTRQIVLPDPAAPDQERPVPVDPALSPAENAQRYYKRFQKAKKTLEEAGRQLEATEAEIRYLESVQAALTLAASVAELEEVEEELAQGGYLEVRSRGRTRPSRPREASPREWISSDGLSILVGRNNRQNDKITFESAKPDDLWLHVKDIAGAHVIIRAGGAPVPEATLEEAAHLAVVHSKAKDSANVPVDCTRRRHVRKPKGAKPGMVIYDHHRTLFVTPDEAVLSRVKPADPGEALPVDEANQKTGRK